MLFLPPPYNFLRIFLTKHTKILPLLCLFVFIIAFGLRLFSIYHKNAFHVDETLSVSISNASGYVWGKALPNGEFFGKELKEMVYWDNPTLSDVWQDIRKLWINNNGDLDHPNLYYVLLRLWNAGVKTGDFEWIKQRGLGLNLVFFVLSFCIVGALGYRLLGASYLVPLLLSLVFLNSAGVSNTIFLREYALQECLIWLFVLNSVLFYQSVKVRFWFVVYYGFCTGLLLLSGYFSLFFVALGVVALAVGKWRNLWTMVSLGIVVGSAFVWSRILYKSYFVGLRDSGRAKEAKAKVDFAMLFENLKQSLLALWDMLQTHYNLYVLCALGLGLLCAFIWRKTHIDVRWRMLVVLGCVACVWVLLVMYLAPYKTLRYIVPAFGLLYCLAVAMLYMWRKSVVGLALAAIMLGGLGAQYTLNHNMLVPMEQYAFAQQYRSPVVVTLPNWSWQYGTLVYLFNDIGKYFIESNPAQSRALLQALLQKHESVYYIGLKDSLSKNLAGFWITNCQEEGAYRRMSCLVRLKNSQ